MRAKEGKKERKKREKEERKKKRRYWRVAALGVFLVALFCALFAGEERPLTLATTATSRVLRMRPAANSDRKIICVQSDDDERMMRGLWERMDEGWEQLCLVESEHKARQIGRLRAIPEL